MIEEVNGLLRKWISWNLHLDIVVTLWHSVDIEAVVEKSQNEAGEPVATAGLTPGKKRASLSFLKY